jgi:hypothetical protein
MGAPAPGGLALPSAAPSASTLYAPRGVWLDGQRLIAADTGNHRVLIWHDADRLADHQDAEVVLGQPDSATEGAQAGGRGPENGLRLPTGVIVHDGRLLVADAWNHRILIWDQLPTASDVPPDQILGQPDRSSVEENRGQGCGPLGFYWPFGMAVVDGWFWVADTGNRRVLGWPDIPEPDVEPEVVLGQDGPDQREENRGQVGPDSFRWPHDVTGTADTLFVADAGNHRILSWTPAPSGDAPANAVLGQPDFEQHGEFPYGPQSAEALRFPYAVDIAGSRMVAADTANNRVLIWDRVPEGSGVPADRVLAQSDFAANGENRWDAVGRDTLCWPYGLSLHQDRVAVADSGNNRVVIWDVS